MDPNYFSFYINNEYFKCIRELPLSKFGIEIH